MRKKTKTAILRAEVLPPTRGLSEADFKRMVAEAIEQKVAEAMSHGSEADFQPWFQPKEVSDEIRRRQTVSEQQKWAHYFEDWGCHVCGGREEPRSLGFCKTCYQRVKLRLRATMRKHAPPAKQDDLSFMDTVRMAREAIAPALPALAETTAQAVRRKRGSR